ncbi:MAG: CCA tRNA nucleotidyltransferase, partial [Pseudomonadota bacterium]
AGADAVLCAAGGGRAPGRGWPDEIARGAAARPPVAAADLFALGAAPGPRLGAALKEIEARWLASGLRADRATLLDGWAPPRGPD